MMFARDGRCEKWLEKVNRTYIIIVEATTATLCKLQTIMSIIYTTHTWREKAAYCMLESGIITIAWLYSVEWRQMIYGRYFFAPAREICFAWQFSLSHIFMLLKNNERIIFATDNAHTLTHETYHFQFFIPRTLHKAEQDGSIKWIYFYTRVLHDIHFRLLFVSEIKAHEREKKWRKENSCIITQDKKLKQRIAIEKWFRL